MKDYGHEVKPIKNPWVRHTLNALGFLSLAVGIIGAFLPIVPTVPFVILSGLIFGRVSPRSYNWLMNHRLFGPPLRQWKETGSITLRAKIIATLLLVLSMGTSIIFFVSVTAGKIAMTTVGLLVLIYIWRLPLYR